MEKSYAMIRGLALVFLLAGSAAAQSTQDRDAGATFKSFLAVLWPQAQARGVTRATFERAFAGVTPDSRVLAATQRQPEYGKPFGAYVGSFISPSRISTGIRHARQLSDVLAAVEKIYGVDRWVVLSIWGVEADYGGYKPRWDVIRSLATLAHARYREELFRDELVAALEVLQGGHISRERMLGSWAGALGQCQFLPSGFLRYAVDFSGDGRRDIWNDAADVLGSIGNYLRAHGWRPGLPWGFEVTVPAAFDYRRSRGAFRDWAALGVRRADGRALPAGGEAILFFPSGAVGPAFLVTDNFVVIKRYNDSDAYALAVAHLADRLHGGAPIHAAWPADDVQLSREERIELQRGLARLGYKVNEFQGHIDFDLRDAIRDVQAKAGRVSDGHPDATVLAIVRSQFRR